MTTTRSLFSNLLAPGLRKIYFDEMKERPSEYEGIFNIESSKRKYEDDYQMAGLGSMPQKSEGVSIIYDDPLSGNTKRYTHLSWGLGFRITHEAYEDDLYGMLGKKMSSQLAKAARNAQEVHAWAILNNAFAASATASTLAASNTFDGYSLCNVAHVRLGGGTQANRSSTDADLSVSSLQAAIDLFEGWTDERGMPLVCVPKRLIIPYQTKWIAREILNSSAKPYTANNEINPLQDEDLSFIVSHYLTDTDSWFLIADKGVHGLNFFWREKARFDNSDDFDSGDAKYKGYQRFVAGVSDWKGVFGSQGA